MPESMEMNDATRHDAFKRDAIRGYTILSEIGKGATGVVYAARNKQTGGLVAIKVLYPFYSHNKDYLHRLTREAELTKRLSHPNIVAGHEYGLCRGHYYFVMEYVKGDTLDRLLKRRRVFGEEEATHIVLEIARALDAAQQLKIVHRDIKPSNIVVVPDEGVKLMDFGLAKEEIDRTHTRHGTIVGTPLYISPEQARGETEIDIRSDIYSLGITFYHLVTGEPPFADLDTALLLTKKITDPIPSPKTRNPNLSDETAYIIGKMCERDKAKRYTSPSELIEALERLAAGTFCITTETEPPKPEAKVAVSDLLEGEIDDPVLRSLLLQKDIAFQPRLLGELEVLFYEEDRSKEAYLLLKGKLEVLKAGRQIALIEKPGAFVGEMSTLLNLPRTATIRALAPTTVLEIKEDQFGEFLRVAPELAYHLAVQLASHLEKTTTLLKDAQAKLAAVREHYRFIRDELES
jgi:serine/threonine protein kinase